ncbi:MAG: hypothetical protein OXH75_10235 [Acidobacteria bacterium]|nr:hypothetical protein [Acidobacteriota bacterium]
MKGKPTVADEAGIATPQLHKEHPDRRDVTRKGESFPADPILALRGVGGALWADEGADAYVARLREGGS